ncbi:type II toxin-antitoxin system PemK/MazF family toxin [Bradyrhizobium elkanii]|uniref:type II toxin-antitoxin system PemK/MazF family toxin n=1 Tax=Bradyrhizobium elkanii TaxID=29448 RepID=UPI0009B66073
MGIKYASGPGTILRCDYSRGGFKPPEMVKPRPAVIISPRLPHRDGLCTVVPISGSPNEHASAWDIRLEFDPPLPHPFVYRDAWAKCDMLATVAFERLDLFHTDRDQYGKRKYLHPKVSEEDLHRIRTGILFALGMGNLTLTGE